MAEATTHWWASIQLRNHSVRTRSSLEILNQVNVKLHSSVLSSVLALILGLLLTTCIYFEFSSFTATQTSESVSSVFALDRVYKEADTDSRTSQGRFQACYETVIAVNCHMDLNCLNAPASYGSDWACI